MSGAIPADAPDPHKREVVSRLDRRRAGEPVGVKPAANDYAVGDDVAFNNAGSRGPLGWTVVHVDQKRGQITVRSHGSPTGRGKTQTVQMSQVFHPFSLLKEDLDQIRELPYHQRSAYYSARRSGKTHQQSLDAAKVS